MGRYPNARNWQGFLSALALALAAVAVPVQAQEDAALPAWRPVDAQTGRLSAIADLVALKAAFPDSAAVRRRLLNGYLEADRPADALAEAVELVERGYVFSAGAQEMLLTLEPTAAQRVVLARQAASAEPIEASRLLATVPADVRLVESVWREPGSGDLFVTSVVSRSLHVRRGEGAWERIELAGAGSLSGMAFDREAGLLWVGSGAFDPTPDPASAFRGVIAIDPPSGREKRRIAGPEGSSPSDLAVAPDGTVYASDPVSGAIYRGRPDAAMLDVLVAPGMFRSPQGIVVLPDDTGIIVSDYGYGLALVSTRTGVVRRMATDAPVLLDGIDGLWRDGGRLIGVQNGARPMRIVELALSADGTRVIAAADREKAHAAWTEPVSGTLSDGELVYVATGQWDRFGDGGAPVAVRPPVPTEIRVLPVE